MRISSVLTAGAVGLALVVPLSLQADTYSDGTYKWGYSTWYDSDTNQEKAYLYSVERVDGKKISGALAFPATVTVTATNELGWTEETYNAESDEWENKWNQTRARKVETRSIPVTQISGCSFQYREEGIDWALSQQDPLITSVAIPEGVEYVAGLVSEVLTNVTSVAFPSTLKFVVSSFGWCDKLASVSLPADCFVENAFFGTAWAKAMGDFFIVNKTLVAYQGTATDVVVPGGVFVIGACAFSAYSSNFEGDPANGALTNLTSVVLPKTLEEISVEAFCGCEKLAKIDIPATVSRLGDFAFEDTALTAITLPAKLGEIGEYAFYHTPISSLAIPHGVIDLYGTCAGMTNLVSVSLPAKAEYMSDTFWGCRKLSSVTIPDGVKDLSSTFGDCGSLTALDIPASVKAVYGAFEGCTNLTSVTGGAGLTTVGGENPFDSDCPLYKNAPDGFRVLGPVAYGFKGEVPENLVVPGTIKYVDFDFPNGTPVKSITLSDGVESVRDYCSFDCSPELETVNLGNTVTNLGYWAFSECSKLAKVTGGAGLKRGVSAFADTKLMYDAEEALCSDDAGADKPFALLRLGSSGVVYGYSGKVPAGEFRIPDDVTELEFWSYEDSVTNVTAISGGASLTALALNYWSGVKRLDVAGPVESISVGNMAALTDVVLSNSSMDYLDGFNNCTNLVNVAIRLNPPHYDEYGDYSAPEVYSTAFRRCDKLQTVKLSVPGYQIAGWETFFSTGREIFPNDASTFKYIGYRSEFNTEPGDYVGWNSYPLRAKLTKVALTEDSLTPFDPAVKSSYAGILYDADGKFAGTFEVAVTKASATKDGTATVKITPINGKKESIKGTVDANGNGQGALAGLHFGANGLTGSLAAPKNSSTFSLVGVADATKAASKSEEVQLLNSFKGKTWGVYQYGLLESASAFANGYAAFTITMGTKGKAKIAGVLPNGTRVSINAKMLVGLDSCMIPVVFARSKESFGFVLWVGKDGKALDLTDTTDWLGKESSKVFFTQAWDASAFGNALTPAVDPVVMVSARDLPDAIAGSALVDYLPTYETFTDNNGRWVFAKAPKIAYKQGVFDEAKYAADVAAGKTNNSGLKLSYTKKTGAFKGSFKVYTLDPAGRLKKVAATVNGVMINGIGYGSALIKKVGTMPIVIGNENLAVEE